MKEFKRRLIYRLDMIHKKSKKSQYLNYFINKINIKYRKYKIHKKIKTNHKIIRIYKNQKVHKNIYIIL